MNFNVIGPGAGEPKKPYVHQRYPLVMYKLGADHQIAKDERDENDLVIAGYIDKHIPVPKAASVQAAGELPITHPESKALAEKFNVAYENLRTSHRDANEALTALQDEHQELKRAYAELGYEHAKLLDKLKAKAEQAKPEVSKAVEEAPAKAPEEVKTAKQK